MQSFVGKRRRIAGTDLRWKQRQGSRRPHFSRRGNQLFANRIIQERAEGRNASVVKNLHTSTVRRLLMLLSQKFKLDSRLSRIGDRPGMQYLHSQAATVPADKVQPRSDWNFRISRSSCRMAAETAYKRD